MMSLNKQLTDELNRLGAFSASSPQTVSLSVPDQVDIAIDFLTVDSMSCAFREIRLNVPSLVNAGFDALKQWAESLCSRVTYLLENIGPLELDPDSKQVLIRSVPPDAQSDATRFYEIILQSHADGNFSLRRYRSDSSGREQVEIQATHEVLGKLVNDLVETIPRTA